ncbi:MAG: hypothetical protein JRJ66_02250 [Deltaproteobacteria bacterium]|nr:hypothetical protein [Deltaproteobacteria bacterium]
MARRYMRLVYDEIRAQTERATLFVFDDRAIWIPQSVSGIPDLDEKTITVQEWFVMHEGLEVYEVE